MYFRNYGPRKTWLDQCVKSPVSRYPSKSNMVNGPKHCWNLKDSSFSIFIDNCEGNCPTKNLSWWYENLKSVSNALSADDKYSPFNGENLTQPVQMQESPKKNCFLYFFSPFLKSSLNFLDFLKKVDPHSWCISDITDPEKPR